MHDLRLSGNESRYLHNSIGTGVKSDQYLQHILLDSHLLWLHSWPYAAWLGVDSLPHTQCSTAVLFPAIQDGQSADSPILRGGEAGQLFSTIPNPQLQRSGRDYPHHSKGRVKCFSQSCRTELKNLSQLPVQVGNYSPLEQLWRRQDDHHYRTFTGTG